MSTAISRHTKLVNWLKIVLPMTALALLSTMFLFSQSSDPTREIPYAEIEAVAQEQRISEPYFSGVADDGSQIALTAEFAAPNLQNRDVLNIQDMRAEIDSAGGVRTLISAGSGQIDSGTRIARLDGLARLATSNGYEMETTGIIAELDTGRIESQGALEARAPFGQLTAGGLLIETPQGASGQQMVFFDGVRLVYSRQNQE